jgi:hypothetical protein
MNKVSMIDLVLGVLIGVLICIIISSIVSSNQPLEGLIPKYKVGDVVRTTYDDRKLTITHIDISRNRGVSYDVLTYRINGEPTSETISEGLIKQDKVGE